MLRSVLMSVSLALALGLAGAAATGTLAPAVPAAALGAVVGVGAALVAGRREMGGGHDA